jgi:hypothetical protein
MTTKMVGTRTRERPRKRWTDEVEEDSRIMGIINWHAVAKDLHEWRKIVLKPKSTTDCSAREEEEEEEECRFIIISHSKLYDHSSIETYNLGNVRIV